MHFEFDVSPAELAKGIDRATVRGLTDVQPALPDAPVSVTATLTGTHPHVVIARDGLRLRSGPSDASAVVRALPLGTRVNVLSREGQWALVDLEGDGLADGFMFLAFLKPVPDEPGGTGRGGADIAAPIAVNRQSVLASSPAEPWVAAVTDIAARSKIARFEWKNRGVAPMGYTKGMALVYARVYGKLKAGNAAATEMAKAKTADTDHDALAWYSGEFAELGMNNDTAGAETLRHLFVLLIGLGMRESSGRYCEGRDTSASNTTAETAEAGLFQTSFNARTASPLLPIIFADYSADPSGFVEVFKEGVRPPCSPADLEKNFGSGDGREFQRLSKACPAFAAEFAAVGLRHARTHWGPINARAAELRPECDEMLRQVQAAVDGPPEV